MMSFRLLLGLPGPQSAPSWVQEAPNLAEEEPKRAQLSRRRAKTGSRHAQGNKKAAKTDPKKFVFFCPFWGPFLDPFGAAFRSVSWTPCPPKSAISHGTSFKNAATKKSRTRAKKDRKSREHDPQNSIKKYEKRSPKNGTRKRAALACSWSSRGRPEGVPGGLPSSRGRPRSHHREG